MGSITEDVDVASLPSPDVLLEVRTGKIRSLGGVSLKSAIAKKPRQGRVLVTEVGLSGDEQQYALHGGVDKALHQYNASHYEKWQEEAPEKSHLFRMGGFGENLVTSQLTESNVCIGDIFTLGPEVVVQISEPRQPCYKLNHRFEWKRTAMRTQTSGRTGWYLRVLKTGYIQEGDRMELVERPNPKWSITRVQQILYHDTKNINAIKELSQLPGLGKEIKDLFQARLDNGEEDMSNRLEGIAGKNRIAVQWRPYKLVEKVPVTARVKKFVFTSQESGSDISGSVSYSPSHMRLKFGPDACFTRAYSVVGGNLHSFELGIAREDNSRGGSQYLHGKLQVGDIIDVGPGHEEPPSKGSEKRDIKHHVFIIGGIGITAFLRDFSVLESEGASFEIHYAVRSMDEAAYSSLLPPKQTIFYAKDCGKRLDVTSIIPKPAAGNKFDAKVYCCGPPSLMKACQEQTSRLGYPERHLHYEDFGGVVVTSGKPFEAEIKNSGQVLQVPGNKTLLDVLNEAGLEVPSSCLAGNCGICMVDYCSGTVEHRGVALTEDQKAESLLSCVSRADGRIVIDC